MHETLAHVHLMIAMVHSKPERHHTLTATLLLCKAVFNRLWQSNM